MVQKGRYPRLLTALALSVGICPRKAVEAPHDGPGRDGRPFAPLDRPKPPARPEMAFYSAFPGVEAASCLP